MSHYDFDAWMADETVENRVLLVVFTSYNYSTGDVKAYHLSNAAYTTSSDDYLAPNLPFDPVIEGKLTKTYSAFSKDLSSSSITLLNSDGRFDSLISGYESAVGQTISFYLGDSSWEFTNENSLQNKFSLIFSGVVDSIKFKTKNSLTISVVDNKVYTGNLSLGKYLVAEGASFGQRFFYIEDAKTVCPIVLGDCFNVPAVFSKHWHSLSKISVSDATQYTQFNYIYNSYDNISTNPIICYGKIIEVDTSNNYIYVAEQRMDDIGSPQYQGFLTYGSEYELLDDTVTIFQITSLPESSNNTSITSETIELANIIYDYPEFILSLGNLEISNVRWKGAPLNREVDYYVFTDTIEVEDHNSGETYEETATFLTLRSIPTSLNSLGYDISNEASNITFDTLGRSSISDLNDKVVSRLHTLSSSIDTRVDAYKGKLFNTSTSGTGNIYNNSYYNYWANFDSDGEVLTMANDIFNNDFPLVSYAGGTPYKYKQFWRIGPHRLDNAKIMLYSTTTTDNNIYIAPFSEDSNLVQLTDIPGVKSIKRFEGTQSGSYTYKDTYSMVGYSVVDTDFDLYNTLYGFSITQTKINSLTVNGSVAIDVANSWDLSDASRLNVIGGRNLSSWPDLISWLQTQIRNDTSGRSNAEVVRGDYFSTKDFGSLSCPNSSSYIEVILRYIYSYIKYSGDNSSYIYPNIGQSNISGNSITLPVENANVIVEDSILILKKNVNFPPAFGSSEFLYVKAFNVCYTGGTLQNGSLLNPNISFNVKDIYTNEMITGIYADSGTDFNIYVTHLDNEVTFNSISECYDIYVGPGAGGIVDGTLICNTPGGGSARTTIMEVDTRGSPETGDRLGFTLLETPNIIQYYYQTTMVPLSVRQDSYLSRASIPNARDVTLSSQTIFNGPSQVLPYNLFSGGMYLDSVQTFASLLEKVAKSINVLWYIKDNTIKFKKLDSPEVYYWTMSKAKRESLLNNNTYDIDKHIIIQDKISLVTTEPFEYSVSTKYRKNNKIQEKDSLAGLVVDLGKAEHYANEFRSTLTEANTTSIVADKKVFGTKEPVELILSTTGDSRYVTRKKLDIKAKVRRVFKVELAYLRNDLEIGDLVWLLHDRFGLGETKDPATNLGLILKITHKYMENSTILEIWL